MHLRNLAATALWVCLLGSSHPALAAPTPTPPPPPAPPPAPVKLLLRDHRALATWLVSHSRDLAATSARVRQAAADVGTSRLLPNPTLDFTMSDLPVPPENAQYEQQGFAGSVIYTVGISQTVELGKRGPRIASAQALLDSARAGYGDALVQRMAEARLALGRVVYLEAKQAVLDERLAAARDVVKLEHARLKGGYLSGNDYERLVLDTLSFEADVERNRSEHEVALAACGALLYASCTVDGSSAADLEAAAPLPASLRDPDLRAALARRFDIKALEAARRSAQEDARGARRRAIPDVTLRLGYMEDRLIVAGDQPHSFQVGMIVPIPAFNRGQHDAAKAQARAAELDHTVWATLRRAQADVAALHRRRDYIVKTLRTLTGSAVPRSASILESSMKAFNAGQISTTDLILARRTHTALLLSVMDFRFDHFTVRNELLRVLGLDAPLAGQVSPTR